MFTVSEFRNENKEIPNFINFNYREKLQNQLHIFQRRLNKEIDYKVMLKKTSHRVGNATGGS